MERRVPNPTGKNGHNCPSKDDPYFLWLLTEYHGQTTNARDVSDLLLVEHGITASWGTVHRRWTDLGLAGSRKTTAALPLQTKTQYVLDEMEKDPSRRLGPRIIKELIHHGKHRAPLTREFVTDTMRLFDPEGFELRQPTAKEIHRVPLVSRGPNEEWSGDGHDKLSKYGFDIWGLRDKFARYWLGLWVLPSNRRGIVIAYCWLLTVKRCGGFPRQQTTDCGSETTLVYGFANALRECFAPHLIGGEKPAHRFLRSVHNIVIERGWLDVRQRWGHNVVIYQEQGEGIYDQANQTHRYLYYWLWPRLIQDELDTLRDRMNKHKTRTQHKKKLPSGAAPKIVYTLWQKHGGLEDCLELLPEGGEALIDDLLMELSEGRGDAILTDYGVPDEFARRAAEVFDSLEFLDVSLANVWLIFQAMLPHL